MLTPAPGVDAGTWIERLRAIEGVERCVAGPGGRRIALLLKRGSFEMVMTEVIRSGFPIATMRRPELAPDLEQIFMKKTTGGVQ